MCRIGMIPSLGLGAQAGDHATSMENVHVGTAAAEIPADRPPDVLFRWRHRLIEERPQAHDLTRRAEAALESIHLNKSRLHGIQLTFAAQPFNRGDLWSLAINREQQTRIHSPVVYQDGTGAAVT